MLRRLRAWSSRRRAAGFRLWPARIRRPGSHCPRPARSSTQSSFASFCGQRRLRFAGDEFVGRFLLGNELEARGEPRGRAARSRPGRSAGCALARCGRGRRGRGRRAARRAARRQAACIRAESVTEPLCASTERRTSASPVAADVADEERGENQRHRRKRRHRHRNRPAGLPFQSCLSPHFIPSRGNRTGAGPLRSRLGSSSAPPRGCRCAQRCRRDWRCPTSSSPWTTGRRRTRC